MAEATGGQPKSAPEEARELLGQKQPGEAARVLREYLADRPGTAEELMVLGVASAQSGDSRGAIEAFEQATERDPNNAAAHFNLAQIYRQVGRLRDALASCERALQLRPEYPAASSAAAELRRQVQEIAPPPAPRAPATPAPPPGSYGYPAAPGYGGPSAAADYREPVSRPLGIAIFVVLNGIGSGFAILFGILLLALGPRMASMIGAGGAGLPGQPGAADPSIASALGVGAAVIGITIIVMSVVSLVISYYLWQGSNWARWAFIVGLALEILISLPFLAKTPILSLLGILCNIVLLVVLNTQAAKDFCSR